MPTYDYKCNKCQNTFEYFQAMSDAPLNSCPTCEGDVRRLVSGGSGLIFKGSGFYLTDYAKQSPSKEKPEKQSKKETKKKPVKESKSK